MNRGAGSISAGLISQHRRAPLCEEKVEKRPSGSVLRGDPAAYRREYERVKGWPKEARRAHLKAWRAAQPGFNWERKSRADRLARVKAYIANEPGRWKAYGAAWRERNREKIRAYSRSRDPGKTKQWREENREAIAAKAAARYRRNPEAVKRATCDCGVKMSITSKACSACYKASRGSPAELADRKRAYQSARNALRRAVRKAAAERVDPLYVFNLAGWRCEYCREETLPELRGTVDPRAPELDHRVPISKGGTHTSDNLALACRGCNSRKKSMLPDEFLRHLRMLRP